MVFRRRRKHVAVAASVPVDATKSVLDKVNVSTADHRERPLSVMPLSDSVNCVIVLPEEHLLVAANLDNAVLVYDIEIDYEPLVAFKQHTRGVRDVVHLEGDLVVSVARDKQLFSWCARTAQLVGHWKHETGLLSVAKLDHLRIIVGDDAGLLVELRHYSGMHFLIQRRFHSHYSWVKDIVVYHNFMISCSLDATAKLWNTTSLELLATLSHEEDVNSAAVSDRRIVTVCDDGNVYVYKNTEGYPLEFILRSTHKNLEAVSIINQDVVVVGGIDYLLSFINLTTKSFLSRTTLEGGAESIAFLTDGRIALAASKGRSAIVSPPNSVRDIVIEYAAILYPSSFLAISRETPLRAAWIAVQENRLSLVLACDCFITSENCSTSLDEWCVAHHILMEAVKCGGVPASRHYRGVIAHWHAVLYQHCAALAIGEQCIPFVKSMFKQAEDAGVIATGQIESLINSISIRRDMDRDNRFAVHAIYQLFVRQAEADVRLRQLFHNQKVQRRTAMVSALVGLCIPIGGSVLTNLISGGAAILNDLQVCGLVESLLGIAKDASGGFGIDRLLDRFLGKSNDALSFEEWSKQPAGKRKYVEEAALNLGLTIDDLRKKLLLVAMERSKSEASDNRIAFGEVDKNVNWVSNYMMIDPNIPEIDVSKENGSLRVESTSVVEASFQAFGEHIVVAKDDCNHTNELKLWKEKGISREAVERLESKEVAGCIAAYLVNYEENLVGLYSDYKEDLAEYFAKSSIFGESITDVDEEDRQSMLEAVMAGLKEAVDERSMATTRMRVKRFFRLAWNPSCE